MYQRNIKRGKDTNATEIWLTARIDFSGVDALEKWNRNHFIFILVFFVDSFLSIL